MVPLINNAGATLRWFIEDMWAQFGDDHTKPGVPLLPSERKNADGSAARVGDETLRGRAGRRRDGAPAGLARGGHTARFGLGALLATCPHCGTSPRMIAQPAVHAADGFAIDGTDSSLVAQAIVAGQACSGSNTALH